MYQKLWGLLGCGEEGVFSPMGKVWWGGLLFAFCIFVCFFVFAYKINCLLWKYFLIILVFSLEI